MPLNLTKQYPDLLEITHLSESEKYASLKRVFDRDITDNQNLKLRTKVIRPTKQDGILNLEAVFHHLVTSEHEEKKGKRVFEYDRSVRLHWLKPHVDESIHDIEVFSVKERDQRKRIDVVRTYILNTAEKYVVVLEPQNSGKDYYLLTAYHLNKPYALKQFQKKKKKKLETIL